MQSRRCCDRKSRSFSRSPTVERGSGYFNWPQVRSATLNCPEKERQTKYFSYENISGTIKRRTGFGILDTRQKKIKIKTPIIKTARAARLGPSFARLIRLVWRAFFVVSTSGFHVSQRLTRHLLLFFLSN